MKRTHKIIGFVLVTLVGVYGCAKGPDKTEASTSGAGKIQRLEADLKAASTARDQYLQELAAAEAQKTQLRKQLDTERAAVQARTTERDTVAAQYDGFRKNLKDLLGQAESALANPSGSLSPTPTTVGTDAAVAGEGSVTRRN
jgi:hypothetical protein